MMFSSLRSANFYTLASGYAVCSTQRVLYSVLVFLQAHNGGSDEPIKDKMIVIICVMQSNI